MAYRFHHLGIIVKNVEEAARLYSDMLGLAPDDRGVVENSEDGLRIMILPTGRDIPIELIEPTRPDNRLGRFLEERGEGLFHLCFFADDFDKEIEELKEKGYTLEEEMAHVDPKNPFRLAWLKPETTTGVWIELADGAATPNR